MGSSQPAQGAGMPFGYVGRGDDLFFEPPEPAPGPALLSFEESQSLNHLLEQLKSGNSHMNMSFGEGLNFSEAWQSLPPQFMGTATSFGHQTTNFSPSMFDFSSHMSSDSLFDSIQFPTMAAPQIMPPPRQHIRASHHSQHSQNSPTNAAAVLAGLQNVQSTRANGISHGAMLPSQAAGRPAGHPMMQNQLHFTGRTSPVRSTSIQSPITPLTEHRDENLFADMAFGNPHGPDSHRVAQQVPEDVHWGSDRTFVGNQSFLAPSARETAQNIENQRMKCLDIFQPINSATNTQPSSPLGSGNSSPVGGRSSKQNGQSSLSRDVDGSSKKRRKSDEGDEEDDIGASSSKPVARKRKSKDNLNENSEASSSAAPGKRRRKSNVNSSKPPRENLSEEAKRRNHIKSEQRRRHIIKDGFENLQEIVPNLKNGGYSKSTVLQMAADWLEELTKGNELLSS
ncbi:BHLH family transcription factor [Seiridium cupressi]